MKNIEILFLTNNNHKINEYKNILPQIFNLNTLKQLNLNPTYVEDGTTFEQNAQIKLDSLATNTLNNLDYIISEDSGICVEALNSQPGIYSARYSGSGDIANNELLIKNMKNIANRNAYFIAVIGLKNIHTNETKFFEHKMHGTIASEISTQGEGFAYDFVFIPQGYDQTLAQLGPSVKNKLSHRSGAITKLVTYLNEQV